MFLVIILFSVKKRTFFNVKPLAVQLKAIFMDFRNTIFRIFNIYKYFPIRFRTERSINNKRRKWPSCWVYEPVNETMRRSWGFPVKGGLRYYSIDDDSSPTQLNRKKIWGSLMKSLGFLIIRLGSLMKSLGSLKKSLGFFDNKIGVSYEKLGSDCLR